MTEDQKQSLEALLQAFKNAGDCGALDVLNDFQRDFDSINDVIESLEDALES